MLVLVSTIMLLEEMVVIILLVVVSTIMLLVEIMVNTIVLVEMSTSMNDGDCKCHLKW